MTIDQIANALHPGGMVILIEPGSRPFSVIEGNGSVGNGTAIWWETLRNCMADRGADPGNLEKFLSIKFLKLIAFF
jgi:hypothetical protein